VVLPEVDAQEETEGRDWRDGGREGGGGGGG